MPKKGEIAVLTYTEVLALLDADETPSILLANGFSQAWNAQIFNYANLFEAADFGIRDAVLRSIFNASQTFDFEVVMKQLISAGNVLQAYNQCPEVIAQIEEDKNILKNSLITAISNTHPDLPGEVSDEQYESVRKFLSGFNQIFTLNYDLLFYWARNKYGLAPANYSTDDGFRKEQRWEGHGTNQEIHFLHGGLHIYDTGTYIKKHVCTDLGVSIIQQVRENLENGRFPLFVSEPTHAKKKEKIEHNPYLNYCFQSLKKLNGTIFIYGHSMDENDKHIFDQIKSSNVNKVFIGIYGNEYSEKNTRSKANALAFLQGYGVEVKFFQAESTPVWA